MGGGGGGVYNFSLAFVKLRRQRSFFFLCFVPYVVSRSWKVNHPQVPWVKRAVPATQVSNFGILFSGPENHDSQRRDRILRPFLRPEIGQFSPHFGMISLPNYTENLEKNEKHPLEKIQKIQWRRRPEIADFCPLSWSNAPWCFRSSRPVVGVGCLLQPLPLDRQA